MSTLVPSAPGLAVRGCELVIATDAHEGAVGAIETCWRSTGSCPCPGSYSSASRSAFSAWIRRCSPVRRASGSFASLPRSSSAST
jgi:hypothetical protein